MVWLIKTQKQTASHRQVTWPLSPGKNKQHGCSSFDRVKQPAHRKIITYWKKNKITAYWWTERFLISAARWVMASLTALGLIAVCVLHDQHFADHAPPPMAWAGMECSVKEKQGCTTHINVDIRVERVQAVAAVWRGDNEVQRFGLHHVQRKDILLKRQQKICYWKIS